MDFLAVQTKVKFARDFLTKLVLAGWCSSKSPSPPPACRQLNGSNRAAVPRHIAYELLQKKAVLGSVAAAAFEGRPSNGAIERLIRLFVVGLGLGWGWFGVGSELVWV